ncbi:hypothetical protein KP509_34G041400 [Ceratopteris richardii]|uniref:adenosylmethionine decarboxylase n=1 Tax=Ceratopteris richardii TaxID=49495 RepID=A0A8T2QKH7_CERRI|nr:hypothetical protein KP509_34G041400 [Ceratopteris richardii]
MGADVSEQKNGGFEGFEKRLEVEFQEVEYGESDAEMCSGLRCLSRDLLDEILIAAECTIVSELHNDWFDAYVLSESSLFVYPRRIILKTCGRTRLLNAIPMMLRHAASIASLKPRRCRYTRGTFIFPDAQPFPYTSFTEEVRVLDGFFMPLALRTQSAYILDGHRESGSSNWHIYIASASSIARPIPTKPVLNQARRTSNRDGKCCHISMDLQAEGEHRSSAGPLDMLSDEGCFSGTYTLEMCMTRLDPSCASHFMNPFGTKSGKDMTNSSGISSVLPNAQISDFAFTPCGYSMNGLEKDALSTIHVTPEEGHSYASFEVMGYDPSSVDLPALINCVVACFKPSLVTMSIHSSGRIHDNVHEASRVLSTPCNTWCTSAHDLVPRGYVCNSTVRKELAGGEVVAFHTFSKRNTLLEKEMAVIPLPLCLRTDKGCKET